MRSQAGIANLSDREVFLAFTAGYVTDFRFSNVGAGGFGAQGLNNILDNLPDQPIEERMHRPDLDVEARLEASFDAHAIEHYLGSHVGTDRWWRLPLVRFRRGDEEIPFYPSIMETDGDEEALLVGESERLVGLVLDRIDGSRSANHIARELQVDFGGFDQQRHNTAMKLIHNLMTLKLVRANG